MLREHAPARDDDERAPQPAAPPPSASILRLQRSAGNRAVGQMIQRMAFIDVLGPLLETGDWVEAKKKARAKEILAEGEKDADKAAKKAGEEVEAAGRHEARIKAGQIVSVSGWVVMKKGLTEGEYSEVVKAFEAWKGDPKQKEKFLAGVPQDKLYLFTGEIARKPWSVERVPEEKALDARPNAAKAQQARKELIALQGKSKKAKARLTDGIVGLLVWGVAERRSADDVGGEGVIGIEHAVDAADTLVAMSTAAYVDTVLQLDVTGGSFAGWDQRRVESVLILKAVAARKSNYKKEEAAARKEVGGFADEIRGEDPDKLAELTSTRDIGGDTGLQQKFTMSCGPTSIQIVRGESDPIFALDISKTAKHTLDYKNKVGGEQEKLLGKDAAPRLVKDRWDAFMTAINGLTPPADDVPRWQALLAWLGGNPADVALRAEGQALAVALGFTAVELGEFKKYIKGLQTEPGLSVKDFQQRIKAAKLAGVTNDKYPLKQFDAGKKPVTDKDLEEMWNVLFRGRDILMGVFWTAGGGHYMVLADARGDPKKKGSEREFLLSDPWEGDSQWISGADLAAGKFGTAGTGYIDDIYY
ncbi:MAG: hypothetical protein ACRDPC_15585 [Solirubrobacteraceae bacterium]